MDYRSFVNLARKRFEKVFDKHDIEGYDVSFVPGANYNQEGIQPNIEVLYDYKEVIIYNCAHFFAKASSKIETKDMSPKKAVKKAIGDIIEEAAITVDEYERANKTLDFDNYDENNANLEEILPEGDRSLPFDGPTVPFNTPFELSYEFVAPNPAEEMREQEELDEDEPDIDEDEEEEEEEDIDEEEDEEEEEDEDINHDDANFKNDIDNNCFIPLDDDYLSFREFLEDIKPYVAEAIYGYCKDDIAESNINTNEIERLANGESFYLLTIDDKDDIQIRLNEHYRKYRTSELEEDEILSDVAYDIVNEYNQKVIEYTEQVNSNLPFDINNYEECKPRLTIFLDNEAGNDQVVIHSSDLELFDNNEFDGLIRETNVDICIGLIESGDISDIYTAKIIPVTTNMAEKWDKSNHIKDLFDDAKANMQESLDELKSSDVKEFVSLKDSIKDEANKLEVPKDMLPSLNYPNIYVCKNPAIILFKDRVEQNLKDLRLDNVNFCFPSKNEVIFGKDLIDYSTTGIDELSKDIINMSYNKADDTWEYSVVTNDLDKNME